MYMYYRTSVYTYIVHVPVEGTGVPVPVHVVDFLHVSELLSANYIHDVVHVQVPVCTMWVPMY